MYPLPCFRSYAVAFVLLLVQCQLQISQAQVAGREPNGFTWGELALLPDYCRDTQGVLYEGPASGGKESPRSPQWLALMGEDFWHMHHYCYGLRNLLRVEDVSITPMYRRSLLERTVHEFQYIIRNCKPTMPLMPEVYLRMGEVLLRMDKVGDALASFDRSRRIKPDYWPAYTRTIDAMLGSRQFEAAEQLAKEGLAHSPDQPELLKRLQASQKRIAPVRNALPVAK